MMSLSRSAVGVLWLVLIGSAVTAAPACDSTRSSPDDTPPEDTPPGDPPPGQVAGAYELRIELALTPKTLGCTQPTYADVWWLAADFPASDPEGSGWIAVIGVETGRVRYDASATRSVRVQGSKDAAGLELDPFKVHLTDLLGILRFESLVLHPDATPGSLVGEVAGELEERTGNRICVYDMQGTVTGYVDEAPPRLAPAPPRIAPFEPVSIRFVEPVAWAGVSAAIMPTAAFAIEPVLDARPGFAVGATLEPSQLWPAGAAFDVTLTGLADAAGNVAAPALTFQSLAAPDSNTNLGLETATPFGWLTAGDVYVATEFDCVETVGATRVEQIEGQAMALLEPSSRLAGFLRPPTGGSVRLRLAVGLCDQTPVRVLQDVDRGLELELITASDRIRIAGSANLPRPANPDAHWTGFATFDVLLPASAATGFWLSVTTSGREPPVHYPYVLVDGAAFSVQ